MHDFAYHRPATLPDAVRLLGEPDAKALAGGQTFIPVLKQRLNQPSALVDLSRLGLEGIRCHDGLVTIGARTTHAAIAASDAVQSAIPGLAKMAGWIGDIQVRHRGTLGGSLANNDPSACYPAAALALGATVMTDRRRIAAADYFQGMFTTALELDEVITEVAFPVPLRSNYEKFRNPASRYAMAGVFVALLADGPRVGVTGAGEGGVFRHAAMEQALAREFSAAALAGVVTPADGLVADIHGSAAYRAHLVTVMTGRAVSGA